MASGAVPNFEDFKKQQPDSGVPNFEDFKAQHDQMPQPAPAAFLDKAQDTVGRTVGTIASDLNPISLIRGIPAALHQGFTPPNMQPTQDAIKAGNYGEAFKRGVGTLPIIGPPLETMTRDLTEGRIPEGIGHAAAFYLGGKAPEMAGRMMGAPAEPLVRSALKLPPSAHEYGAEPEAFTLQHTTGTNIPDIENQSRRVVESKMAQRDAGIRAADTNGTTVSLRPSRNIVTSGIQGEQAKNLIPTEMDPIQEHITVAHPGFQGRTVPTNPGELAEDQLPSHFQSLKQGVQNFARFNPNNSSSTPASAELARSVHHQMGEDLNAAVPGTAGLNHIIQSGIPVAERTHKIGLNAGPLENAVDAATARTGALVGPAVGLASGHPGVAAATFATQQFLNSPAFKMRLARMMFGGGRELQSPIAARAGIAAPIVTIPQEQQ